MVMTWQPKDELASAVALEVLIHGPLGRAELARRLGLAPATLTRISTELIASGLLAEVPEATQRTSGRPTIPLDVVPSSHYFLGIKLTDSALDATVIDLTEASNRQQLFEHMTKAMANDRAKHNILPLSKFCLMQITRQRVRPILDVQTTESCPSCFGTGVVKSSILFTDNLEGKIDCLVNRHNVKRLTLNVHPYVAAYINKGIFSLAMKWKMKYTHQLKVVPDQSLAFLEYKFYDQDKNELDMQEEKEIVKK